LSESEPYYSVVSDLRADKLPLFLQFYFLSTWDVTQDIGVLILY